ncbi:MAG: Gfo/Idh/MocA family protein [Mucilaginibacter sp.]
MSTFHNLNRRGFIRSGAIGIGALALSPALNALALNKPGKKLGIAIVGLGMYAGGQIAPALQHTQNCYLAGLVSGHPDKAAEWATKYNVPPKNIYNYQNFDTIAQNPDIDIVYVILPVALHKEYTIRAAKAGKHVICEKPMAVSVKDCEEMVAACKKAKRLLSIGYRMQFEPYTAELIRISRGEVYGKLKAFDCANGFTYTQDPKAWRLNKALAGGGSLYDMGVYTIQSARYTIGMEPVAVVSARQEKTNPVLFKEVDDKVFFELEFPNGFIAKCKSSYSDQWSSTHAEFEHGNVDLNPNFYYGGIKGNTPAGPMNFPQVNQQALQMDDFANCVSLNRESKVNGYEGIRDMKVVEAIYKSLASGKRELV